MTCEWPLILLDEFQLHVHRSKTKSQAFIGVLPDKQLTVEKIWTSVFANTLEPKLVSVITTGHPSTLVEPNFLFFMGMSAGVKRGSVCEAADRAEAGSKWTISREQEDRMRDWHGLLQLLYTISFISRAKHMEDMQFSTSRQRQTQRRV